MTDFVTAVVYSFSILFVILDPILSIPIFSAMTQGQTKAEIYRQGLIAVAVAGFLMYIFLFFNFVIFSVLGITLPAFQVAGGSILFILGLQMALGLDIGQSKEHKKSAAGVVIGTPLLCGPGTITTVLLLSSDYGIPIVAVAIALCLLATWIILRFASTIQKILGDCVTDIMGRVLGMLLAAIAIKIISQGILGLIG
ncbi:MAG: MarC family protein [Methanoregulaceae archaeon]